MKRYVLTAAAKADLKDITEFIATDNRNAAARVRNALREAMRHLAERPLIGHVRADLADDALRFWPVYSYLIIYRPDTSPLQVIRVLHGARDVQRLLED
jgi:plasmid stabilization system protein ParE